MVLIFILEMGDVSLYVPLVDSHTLFSSTRDFKGPKDHQEQW